MQLYWDGTYTCITLNDPVVSAVLGAPGLELQGAKPLFRSIALALVVSSLPVHSLSKAS